MKGGIAIFILLLLASISFAQEGEYRDAYLSYVEGDVSVQRASEPEPETGSINVPILPGDRLWTHSGSRAEMRFDTGVVVHLSERTKVDFVARETETILRLWNGSAIVKISDPSPEIRIDTPAGAVRPGREGSYRIDIEEDTVTLSVLRGSADLANSQGTVLAQSGETTYATASDAPSIPSGFNTASQDDFDRWSESRLSSRSRTPETVVRSLPHAVQSYADDLEDYGEWDDDPDYGSVWYPQVSAGWAPYTYGSWAYTNFGYTWVSHEPWGWAPYHYGRWGYGHRGWYWIPGSVWGPAWVSFSIGPTWVGWGPLGYYGGPVFAFNTYYGGFHGYYYPRRGHRYPYYPGGGWNVCSRDDFRRGFVTRNGYRRLDPESVRTSVGQARFVDGTGSLNRDLGMRTARARVRPSTADPQPPRAEVRGREATPGPTAPSRSRSGFLRGESRRSDGMDFETRIRRELRGADDSDYASRIRRELRGAPDPSTSIPSRPSRISRPSPDVSPRERRSITERSRSITTPRSRAREAGPRENGGAPPAVREPAPRSPRTPSESPTRSGMRDSRPQRSDAGSRGRSGGENMSSGRRSGGGGGAVTSPRSRGGGSRGSAPARAARSRGR